MSTNTRACSSLAREATRSKSLATALPDSENHLEKRAGAETSSSSAPPGKREEVEFEAGAEPPPPLSPEKQRRTCAVRPFFPPRVFEFFSSIFGSSFFTR